jgi:ribonuclease BN (tRNA processing enzyme)
MRVTVAGCSPAWPNPGSAHSGYLVDHGQSSVLLDCGPGVLARLRERDGWPDPDAIVITHFHLDHWGDLVPWVWGALNLGNGAGLPRPELWLPSGGIATLEQFGGLLGFPDMFDRAFRLFEYTPGEPFDAGGCSITASKVPHYHLDAHALRLEADGRVLAYSGDSGPSKVLADVARGANLFICEATLRAGDLDGRPRGHLSLDEAVEAFEASGARSLLVTHRPAELDVPAGIPLAFDGHVREV